MAGIKTTNVAVSHWPKTPPSATPSRPGVLLVQDAQRTRTSIAQLIEQHGLAIRDCSSAEQALLQFRDEFYPIVITDAQMPGMGGLALCRKLRSRRLPGYVYIIVLTSQDHCRGVIAAADAGADDCLSKECPPAELLARLNAAERIVSLDQRLRRALKSASRQAASDTLTRLPNRRAFNQRFHAELKRAHRFGEPVSVLLIDVDHFKQINDRYGHLIGDEVLRRLAGTLRTHLPREFDVLARLGGEEFAAALPHTDQEAARIVAERLRSAVADCKFPTAVGDLRVTVSVGISSSLADVSTPRLTMADLLGEADHCLYESKQRGRNRVTVPDDDRPARRRL